MKKKIFFIAIALLIAISLTAIIVIAAIAVPSKPIDFPSTGTYLGIAIYGDTKYAVWADFKSNTPFVVISSKGEKFNAQNYSGNEPGMFPVTETTSANNNFHSGTIVVDKNANQFYLLRIIPEQNGTFTIAMSNNW